MKTSLIAVLMLLLFLSAPAIAQTTSDYPGWQAAWDGQSRFTILVMGVDRRPDDMDRRYLDDVRADVMMVLSFNPADQSIGILAIPRDIHLPLAANGEHVRVNSLLVLGEDIQPAYGPYYALETLQYNLGMYIDGWVAFDFAAFSYFVDAIGGITLDVPYFIDDSQFPDMNYGYDPLYLTPGTYTFNGYDALRYARTRHGDNDYVRGERQLQVVNAIRQKVTDPFVMQGLIANAPELVANLNGNLYTNIPLDQAVSVALAMRGVSPEKLKTGVLNQSYSFEFNGMRVPDRNKMPVLMTQLFGGDYAG
jgi:polyisoprenyl-teichoic acid--peptidoglycan teichoic acid transferase